MASVFGDESADETKQRVFAVAGLEGRWRTLWYLVFQRVRSLALSKGEAAARGGLGVGKKRNWKAETRKRRSYNPGTESKSDVVGSLGGKQEGLGEETATADLE